jgi:hypothetical protein
MQEKIEKLQFLSHRPPCIIKKGYFARRMHYEKEDPYASAGDGIAGIQRSMPCLGNG